MDELTPPLLITRRRLQVVLGVLWLLDGALQFQPFMFGPRFAADVISPAAAGQAHLIASAVTRAAGLVAGHPLAWNASFAGIQLLIGAGLLWPRTAAPALATSIAWALSVWVFGEGLGGLTGAGATLWTGAPGPALLYAVLAAAALPGRAGRGRSERALPGWLPIAWAAYWIGGAVLQTLHGPHTGTDLAASVAAAANTTPRWMGDTDLTLATSVAHLSSAAVASVVAVQALIGIAGLAAGWWRWVAAVVGAVAALGLWSLGEGFGQLTSGQATDPNIAPLVVILAATLASSSVRVSGMSPGTRRHVELVNRFGHRG